MRSGITGQSIIRPDWLLQIGREVEAFVRALPGRTADPSCLEHFFAALPAPELDLERWILREIKLRLAFLLERPLPGTRAEQARRLLADEYRKPWTLASLARAVGSNRTTLQAEFHTLTRTTVHQFLVQRRVSAAVQLLESSDLKVSRVSREVGYRSHSAFIRHFKKITGLTLTSYRGARQKPAPAFRERVPAEREPHVA